MEWFFNPWVICVIIIAVIASNIAALKYTAYMRTGLKKRHPPQTPFDDSQSSHSTDTHNTHDNNHSQDKND
ncbi:DUF2897 family protein [Photobacterium piscicola]|uniref:DUF2897 family protein n=1 Tax=Photobacterium piscicola TaxID=1378299 RepID=A0A1T5HZN0_9GAMM|nr:DUF2897 family protein [Photobacterium piscicola]MEC6821880.1 DUF2897 family protein [Photobacterium piscicola]MEC6880770.1 DUF2897 family protein [Photobacterium piscicola]MEC6897728.1 DUF2897 family protein [Photobacterium piscicola]SKC32244.1 hypothetical protein CZ809_01760 [Photobacterium piscicola]